MFCMPLFVTYRTVIWFLFLQKSVSANGREGILRTMSQEAASYQYYILHYNHFPLAPQDDSHLVWDVGPGSGRVQGGAGHCQFSALGVQSVGSGRKEPRFLLGDASVRPSQILAVFTLSRTVNSGKAPRLPARAEWHFLVLRNNCVLWRPEGTVFVDFASERRATKQLDFPQRRSEATNIY